MFSIFGDILTAPQDAHKRLVLQVYFGSNTLEFSAIHRLTAPQDAHKRLVLEVYLGSNTSEFSAIHR